MSKHTKAPWDVVHPAYAGFMCTSVVHWEDVRVEDGSIPQPQLIAKIAEGMDETEANARLISRAPELLSACKAAIEFYALILKDEGCDHSVGICWCGARSELERLQELVAAIEEE